MKSQTDHIIALIASIRDKANLFISTSLAEQGIDDLLPAHGAVLNALWQTSPMQMSELAKMIDRKKNTVTGLINTLEERGYCYRVKDPLDGRVQLIALTKKGEAIKEKQVTVSTTLLKKTWQGIAINDQEICIRVLQKISENFLVNDHHE